MALARVDEKKFYRAVTGEDFPGEYGEREAARRRGSKFESNLHQNNAAKLRKALAALPGWGLDAEAMTVRNFADEIPGPPDTMRAARLTRTRLVLKDLAAGREVPHVLIQPQLALPLEGGPSSTTDFISPDFLVLDARNGIYVPGEEKSFITRQNVAEPSDRDLTRRQAGAQILALRAETQRARIKAAVAARAVFVFATPYGLEPASAFEEQLDAEVYELTRAIVSIAEAKQVIERLRGSAKNLTNLELSHLFDDLPRNFQEGCLGSCIMSAVCEKREAGTARALGDAATQLLGPDTQLVRAIDLVRKRARPRPDERELVEQLRRGASALGLSEDELLRRLA
jgi:hypothetical protein